MLKLLRCFLPALVGLGMASAHAADTRFDAFMQTVSGNKSTISFGTNGIPIAISSAPVGSAAVQSMGFTKTAEGVFMESIGSARVPGTTSDTIPVTTKLKLSGLAIGKGLVKGAVAAFGISSVWSAGSELYDIWADLGSKPCPPGSSFPLCKDQESMGKLGFWIKDHTAPTAPPGGISSNTAERECELLVADRKPPSSVSYVYSLEEITPPPQNAAIGSYGHYATCSGRYYEAGGQQWYATIRYLGWVNQNLPSIKQVPQTEQEVLDKIATASGWPSSSTLALQKALQYPEAQTALADAVQNDLSNRPEVKIGSVPQGVPVQVGEPVVTTQTSTASDGSTVTKTQTASTTVTASGNQLVGNTTTQTVTTTTSPSGQVKESTTTTTAPLTSTGTGTGTGNQEQDGECGFGDNPNCKIEEAGTPEVQEDTSSADSQTLLETVTNCVADLTTCFQVPAISLTFSLPTGCGPLPITAFGDFALSFDICEYQPTIHDLMSMLWAAAGLFGAAGLLFRSSGA